MGLFNPAAGGSGATLTELDATAYASYPPLTPGDAPAFWWNDVTRRALRTKATVLSSNAVPTTYSHTGLNAMADGVLNACMFWSPATTLTGMKWFQSVQGSYTADNENRIGIYTINTSSLLATLAASCADDGTLWKSASNTLVTKAFTSPLVVASGQFVLAVALYNNSVQVTAPTIQSANPLVTSSNPGLYFGGPNPITDIAVPTSFARSAVNTLPATIDLTAVTYAEATGTFRCPPTIY